MDESQKTRLLDGLRNAIQSESDGYHFYTIAASQTSDEKGKEVFMLLANEERIHMDFLKGQYKHIAENGAIDSNLALGEQDERLKGPIFTDDFVKCIGDAHFEMSALSIGIQLELSSIDYYTKQADAADDPEVEKFFRELADWERGHYDTLHRQQELLKEDYWNEAGFAPF